MVALVCQGQNRQPMSLLNPLAKIATFLLPVADWIYADRKLSNSCRILMLFFVR